MQFYKRIRDTREDNDITQEQIAKVLNITRQQYQLYESGKREIKTTQLAILCKYYNITADYFLELTDKPHIIK